MDVAPSGPGALKGWKLKFACKISSSVRLLLRHVRLWFPIIKFGWGVVLWDDAWIVLKRVWKCVRTMIWMSVRLLVHSSWSFWSTMILFLYLLFSGVVWKSFGFASSLFSQFIVDFSLQNSSYILRMLLNSIVRSCSRFSKKRLWDIWGFSGCLWVTVFSKNITKSFIVPLCYIVLEHLNCISDRGISDAFLKNVIRRIVTNPIDLFFFKKKGRHFALVDSIFFFES